MVDCSASYVLRMCSKESEMLWREVRGEHNRLSEKSCIALEIPHPYAAEIAAMSFLGLQVQVFEDMIDMIPILHEQCVCLVQDHDFDG